MAEPQEPRFRPWLSHWLLVAILLGLPSPGCREPSGKAPAESAGLLARFGYSTGDGFRYLPSTESLAEAPEPVRRQLTDVLEGNVSEARGAEIEAPPGGFSRRYQLRLGRAAKVALEEPAGNPGWLLVRSAGRERAVVAPELLRYLRKRAFRRLQVDMLPPWEPLPWHPVALAFFLGSGVSLDPPFDGMTPSSRDLPAKLLEHLRTAAEPGPLALALLERVDLFTEADLEPLLRHERIAVRVLALTRRAGGGDRAALREITVLSLEYHGETELFDRVLRTLFPEPENPLLHRRHPADRDPSHLAFAREIRERLEEVSHAEGRGWKLE